MFCIFPAVAPSRTPRPGALAGRCSQLRRPSLRSRCEKSGSADSAASTAVAQGARGKQVREPCSGCLPSSWSWNEWIFLAERPPRRDSRTLLRFCTLIETSRYGIWLPYYIIIYSNTTYSRTKTPSRKRESVAVWPAGWGGSNRRPARTARLVKGFSFHPFPSRRPAGALSSSLALALVFRPPRVPPIRGPGKAPVHERGKPCAFERGRSCVPCTHITAAVRRPQEGGPRGAVARATVDGRDARRCRRTTTRALTPRTALHPGVRHARRGTAEGRRP